MVRGRRRSTPYVSEFQRARDILREANTELGIKLNEIENVPESLIYRAMHALYENAHETVEDDILYRSLEQSRRIRAATDAIEARLTEIASRLEAAEEQFALSVIASTCSFAASATSAMVIVLSCILGEEPPEE